MNRQSVLESELFKQALDKERWWSRILFWGAAGLLGCISVFFAALCEWANEVFHRMYEYSPYLPFLVCPTGFFCISRIQKSFFPGAEGSGIPQVIASLQSGSTLLKNRLLSIRVLVGKIICAFLGLLSGASIGREGPSVHIGASLFHSLGHFAHFSRFERRQGLIVAGAAAGIAAAFNAPLAGIVFAIEELKGSFEERSSGLTLSAVILAGLIALAFLGHYTYFGRIDVTLDGLGSVVPVIILSVVGGLAGGGMSRSILFLQPRFRQIEIKNKWLVPIGLGLGIAFLGYMSDGRSFGTGYLQTRALLENPTAEAGLFPFWKFMATLLSYVSGIAGGVFAPSLSIGAGFGHLSSVLFPLVDLQALIILGMVSFLSAVIRAPVTAFVIVFEMTSNHLMLLPLMACAFIATGISKLVCRTSLYRGLAESFSKRSGSSTVRS